MDRVSQQMAAVAKRWGVHIEFVRIQKVEAGELTRVLAKKKNADLKNKEVIIAAKAQKQTKVIESEGHRDRMIREAEGEAQQIVSRGPSVRRFGVERLLCVLTSCGCVFDGVVFQHVVKHRPSPTLPTPRKKALFRCVGGRLCPPTIQRLVVS